MLSPCKVWKTLIKASKKIRTLRFLPQLAGQTNADQNMTHFVNVSQKTSINTYKMPPLTKSQTQKIIKKLHKSASQQLKTIERKLHKISGCQ